MHAYIFGHVYPYDIVIVADIFWPTSTSQHCFPSLKVSVFLILVFWVYFLLGHMGTVCQLNSESKPRIPYFVYFIEFYIVDFIEFFVFIN